jgi:hypothetical protein
MPSMLCPDLMTGRLRSARSSAKQRTSLGYIIPCSPFFFAQADAAPSTRKPRLLWFLCRELTSRQDFRQCTALISSITPSRGAHRVEVVTAKNVQRGLAKKVQELSAQFRKKQRVYMQSKSSVSHFDLLGDSGYPFNQSKARRPFPMNRAGITRLVKSACGAPSNCRKDSGLQSS